MTGLLSVLAGRRAKWLTVACAIAISVLVFAFRGEAPADSDPTSGLPTTAESTQVARLQQRLTKADTTVAVIVFYRPGGTLNADDETVIGSQAGAMRDIAFGGTVPPPVIAPTRKAGYIVVPLASSVPPQQILDEVDGLRARVKALPGGLQAKVTGGAGFTTDLTRVFAGADVSLLLTTVVVVAVLLLVTYRSPVLWLVPLAVVGLADQVAAALGTILDRTTSLVVDPSTAGITSVLVFGAGTNYALLLIARYREELRKTDDRHAAMAQALRSAAPAIIASAGTVILSLLTLTFADLTSNRSLGITAAVGVATALLFAVLVLPAALVLFGRGLFWPFVPKVGSANPTLHGFWSRVGKTVARRPAVVAVAAVLLLGALAAGVLTQRVGLTQTQNFRERVESIEGQDLLTEAFSAGVANPLIVITTNRDLTSAVDVAKRTPGVSSATPGRPGGQSADDLAQFDVVIDAEPGTDAFGRTLSELRADLPESALVGGQAAADYDKARAADRDRGVVAPLVLAVVFVILMLLLRSVVAAVVLVGTVVISYFAALGASSWLFHSVFDFPALDVSVPLLSFLFLVALGVDYNIFLTTRAREETVEHGTRQGMTVALAVTGGVITSAGILLAAVFAVLGVLPLIVLTQIGVIVGLGVLLDTLLVRSVLVPAAVNLLNDHFWWPSHPDKQLVSNGSDSPKHAAIEQAFE